MISAPYSAYLSNVCLQLDVAFRCYEPGKPDPLGSNFDNALGGPATQDYLKVAVRPCFKSPDRWNQVMDRAKEFAS